jgi:hypothetical protein
VIPVEITPKIRGEGDEGEWLMQRIYVYLIQCRNCANATIYPHPSQL